MKSVQVGRRNQKITNNNNNNKIRKSLSVESNRGLSANTVPSAPCSCRECKANLKKLKTPRIPIQNNNNSSNTYIQDKGDCHSSRTQSKKIIVGGSGGGGGGGGGGGNNNNSTPRSSSRQVLKTKFFPSNNKENYDVNIVKKSVSNSSSTTFLLEPREIIYPSNSKPDFEQNEPPSRQESIVQLYKSENYCPSRVSSATEGTPVLRKKVTTPCEPHSHYCRQHTPIPPSSSRTNIFKRSVTPQLPPAVSSVSCTCKHINNNFDHESISENQLVNSQSSVHKLKSSETVSFIDKNHQDCHFVHPAHTRRISLTNNPSRKIGGNQNSKLPPLPPQNHNNKSQGGQQPSTNRQNTAILSVGANTVGIKHLNNYHPGESHSSPSFIVETVSSNTFCDLNSPSTCTLAKTLPFSLEHELQYHRPHTSHSILHITESCTNLNAQLLKTSEPCLNCPLCKESKSQITVHHRSMQSRYMTDLEWRICHAVNIYVYRNGLENQTPILVHIPPARKKNMKNVMAVVQDRMKYPIGYAKTIYKMDGTRIRHPCELEMYNNYVVGSNYDKHFKCVQYGRKRSPLLILARESKHVRVLRQQNEHYDQWLLKKKAAGDERPQYVYPVLYTKDGYGPADLPVGQGGNYQPCGPFCKLKNGQCGPMNHEDCGPDPSISARNNQQPEYIVNTMTIPTFPTGITRDPPQLLKQKNILKNEDDDYVDVDVENFKNKNIEPTIRKYKTIGKNEESFFYGTKPRKKSKGVIDTSGDKKLFATRALVDINANLLKNEYDEIPDFSDRRPPFNTELELCEVVDETLEAAGYQNNYHEKDEQKSTAQSTHRDFTRKSRTKQNLQELRNKKKGNNTSISATSGSYTIVTKMSPPIQQGGTQTRNSSQKTTTPKNRSTLKISQEMQQNNVSKSDSHAVSYFIPISPNSKQKEYNLRTQTETINQNPPGETLMSPILDGNSHSAVESVSSGSQGFNLNSNPSGTADAGDEQQQMSWNMLNNNSNDVNRCNNNGMGQVQQQPVYQGGPLNQGPPFRPFIIDGSSRFDPAGSYFASRDPEPQENFANQYDELSDIMAGIDEVDIPFTPIQSNTRNTYQPPPNFYPPYQDIRFLSKPYTFNNEFNKQMAGPYRTQIDKPKVRNVATQFGTPSFDDLKPIYKNSNQGQQQMLQDSYQNQQMRMHQAIIQQQQLAAQLGNAAPIIYSSPVFIPSAVGPFQGGQQVQYVQQQPIIPQQIHNQNWNNVQQSQPQLSSMQTQNTCIPPPTQFRDLGNCQNSQHFVTMSGRTGNSYNNNNINNTSTNSTQQRRSETIKQGRKPQSGQRITCNSNYGRIS